MRSSEAGSDDGMIASRENSRMKRCARFVALLALAGPAGVSAQQPMPAAPAVPATPTAPAAEPKLSDKELLGRTLFNQSCVVCHMRMQITTAGHFGPPLSRDSLGGQADIMREVISNGTPNMPGFKYHFAPREIEAIVAYLKTRPVPAAR